MISVVGRDKVGLVYIRDDRDDGSWVLLVCQEFQPSDGGGVVSLPDTEEFPMPGVVEKKLRMHAEQAGRKQFSLDVDISEMPRGELRFHNREFIEQAVQESERTERAQITPENAARWGLIDGSDNETR